MNNDGFIKFNRNYDMTIHQYPNAFNLLAVIARRAKRSEQYSNRKVEMGEALIGDYKTCGMTEQGYRTAKKILRECKIVTFRATNKGTVARLIDSSIFDINPAQPTDKTTDGQRKANDQVTTNKKNKNEKNIYNNPEYLLNIPTQDTEFLTRKFNVSDSQLKVLGEAAYDWLQQGGKVKKDYQAFLRSWIRNKDKFTFKVKDNSGGQFAYYLRKMQSE